MYIYIYTSIFPPTRTRQHVLHSAAGGKFWGPSKRPKKHVNARDENSRQKVGRMTGGLIKNQPETNLRPR